jgi:hypothetical protein
MELFLTSLAVGAVIGTGLTLIGIFGNYKVERREWWEEYERKAMATQSGLEKAVAENAQLRVALAAGEMTEEGKKVAAMTLASFDADIAISEKALNQDGCV